MGRDGAIGLKALRMKGYHTIARTRRRAPYGMPKAAATLGAARAILPLGRIAGELAALARIWLDDEHAQHPCLPRNNRNNPHRP